MGDVRLDYAVPGHDLAPYCTLFYRFSADMPVFEDTERADYAQFRFILSPSDADYRFADGSAQAAPPNHVLGATSGAWRSRATGPLLLFGVGLTPAGWAAMIGADASTMVNRVLDANALFGPQVRATAATLATCDTVEDMAAVATPLFAKLFAGEHGVTLSFVKAVDAWLAATASPEVEDLVATSGLSRRQVERRCNALYGAPPKVLARKFRALRAAVALAVDGAAVDSLIEEGFYDQSHMIREIKHFTGLTPKRMKDEPGVLAHLTSVRRRALDGQVGPLVSRT